MNISRSCRITRYLKYLLCSCNVQRWVSHHEVVRSTVDLRVDDGFLYVAEAIATFLYQKQATTIFAKVFSTCSRVPKRTSIIHNGPCQTDIFNNMYQPPHPPIVVFLFLRKSLHGISLYGISFLLLASDSDYIISSIGRRFFSSSESQEEESTSKLRTDILVPRGPQRKKIAKNAV
jgi:hypothetical protein